jgi:hypothetical protein
LRRDTKKKMVRFLVSMKDNKDIEKWVVVEDLLDSYPSMLCDFLLRHMDLKK